MANEVLAGVSALAIVWSAAAARGEEAAPGGTIAAAAAAPGAAAGTLLSGSDDLASGRGAVAAARRPKPIGAGGADLVGALDRRLAEEERRKADLARASDDRRLSQFMAEIRSYGPNGGFSRDDETPGDAFLRAVAPPDLSYASIRRHGFDKFAMHLFERAFRRAYRQDVSIREALAPHTSPDEKLDEARRLRAAADEDRLRWQRPFPAYWRGGPAGEERPRVTLGERIEVFRAGRLSFDNELRLRFDLRSVLWEPPDREEGSARRAHQGALYASEIFELSGKIGVQTGAAFADPTEILARLTGEMEWRVLERHDRKPIFSIRLKVDFEPSDGSAEGSLLFSFARF